MRFLFNRSTGKQNFKSAIDEMVWNFAYMVRRGISTTWPKFFLYKMFIFFRRLQKLLKKSLFLHHFWQNIKKKNYFLANQKKVNAKWLAMDGNAAAYIQKGKDCCLFVCVRTYTRLSQSAFVRFLFNLVLCVDA